MKKRTELKNEKRKMRKKSFTKKKKNREGSKRCRKRPGPEATPVTFIDRGRSAGPAGKLT